jgi:DNA-binding winged helix-turn-helix (wHTH) protein
MDLMNATSQLDDVVFRFEKFELIPGRRLLARDGRVVKVGSRAFDLLVALVERAGKVVRKDELVSCVWANVVVEDTNLRVHISSLRRLLGDDGLESRYIVHVARQGYIFVAPLLDAESDIGRPKRNAYRVLGEDSCRTHRAVA